MTGERADVAEAKADVTGPAALHTSSCEVDFWARYNTEIACWGPGQRWEVEGYVTSESRPRMALLELAPALASAVVIEARWGTERRDCVHIAFDRHLQGSKLPRSPDVRFAVNPPPCRPTLCRLGRKT